MKKFMVTFANDTAHPVIAIDELEARKFLMKLYEGNWCSIHDEEEWEKIHKEYNYKILNLTAYVI